MNDRSSLRRFLGVSREFGLPIAMRVAYSKIRGVVWPALALPAARIYDSHREVSFLLDSQEHEAATLAAVVEAIARRGGADWEICIGERCPVVTPMDRALAMLRGARPWIRIVRTDGSVDDTAAAQWTVEQATGRFVGLIAPDYAVRGNEVERLLERLHGDPEIDAAVLFEGDSKPRAPVSWADCRLVLQRKSGYLDVPPERWRPLTAPAWAEYLEGAGVATAYIGANQAQISAAR